MAAESIVVICNNPKKEDRSGVVVVNQKAPDMEKVRTANEIIKACRDKDMSIIGISSSENDPKTIDLRKKTNSLDKLLAPLENAAKTAEQDSQKLSGKVNKLNSPEFNITSNHAIELELNSRELRELKRRIVESAK